MHAAGNEVIPRAFRGRLREHRRLDLEEAGLREIPPRGLHQTVAQEEVPLQLVAPEVEVAMPQTQLLRGELLALPARHRDRGRLGGTEHAQSRRLHLYAAGAQLRVAHRLRTLRDDPFDEHDGLGAERRRNFGDLGRRLGEIDRDLNEAGTIAQVEEHEPAEVARAMHPAAEPDRGADVLVPKCATEMRAKGRRECGVRHAVHEVVGDARSDHRRRTTRRAVARPGRADALSHAARDAAPSVEAASAAAQSFTRAQGSHSTP